MINLIIASSIRLLFYMNLVGSIFLFLSIGATHLFSKQLAPKHKLLFWKVNIFLFLLPVPLLTNYYKTIIFPHLLIASKTKRIKYLLMIQSEIVQNQSGSSSTEYQYWNFNRTILCISLMLFRAIYIRRLYLQTKKFLLNYWFRFNFKKSFSQTKLALQTYRGIWDYLNLQFSHYPTTFQFLLWQDFGTRNYFTFYLLICLMIQTHWLLNMNLHI